MAERIIDVDKYTDAAIGFTQSLGSIIPEQLAEETKHAYAKLNEALGCDVAGFVANRLQMSPEELAVALAAEQVDGAALAIYNIEARGQSVIIGDQTGIGKGRQAVEVTPDNQIASITSRWNTCAGGTGDFITEAELKSILRIENYSKLLCKAAENHYICNNKYK